MKSNPLVELAKQGQSIWLDNLTRSMLQSSRLADLIRKDSLSGVTSNPAIFHKAMTSGDLYDAEIRRLSEAGKSAGEIYETLAIQDVRGAADLLREVFDRTEGADGFVSLEVSPHLARNTRDTVEEARRLWKEVDRPNVLIKIPGTAEGVPAIETCLTEGINVNVTLLFSLDAHRRVIEAGFRAQTTRRELGKPLGSVVSVASYFLSRIDVKVDKMLDGWIASGGEKAREAGALRGRAAIASARLAYQMWKGLHAADPWLSLEKDGARIQKPLWASTSTKDARYSDVKYVEALIGPHTINTLPDETVDAFRDHGRVEPTLERNLEEERGVVRRLAGIGVDLARVTSELEEEGIEKFVRPFDQLLESLEEKRRRWSRRG